MALPTIHRENIGNMTIVEPESRCINENGPIISVTAAEEVLHLVVGDGGGGKEKNPII